MLRRRIEERLGSCSLHGSGWLTGYDLRFHKISADGSGKCDVYRTDQTADKVHGALFELTTIQKARLDEFEGPGYDSAVVVVRSDLGDLEADTYVAKSASIDPTLIPFDWYKAFVVEGGKEVGLPDNYISFLEKVRAGRDPDTERRKTNWSLLTPVRG